METISGLFDSIQRWLLPVLEEEVGELTEKHREFIRVAEAETCECRAISKVFAHLMFGIIIITVNQLYNMLL